LGYGDVHLTGKCFRPGGTSGLVEQGFSTPKSPPLEGGAAPAWSRSTLIALLKKPGAYQQVADRHRSKRRLTVASQFLRLPSSPRFDGE
jgi:hypothetical protein